MRTRNRARTAATAAGTALAAALLTLAGSSAAQAAPAGYKVYGGSYNTFQQCVEAGSLSVGLGFYSRYECNSEWGKFALYYVD
jgi:hypothetical protein